MFPAEIGGRQRLKAGGARMEDVQLTKQGGRDGYTGSNPQSKPSITCKLLLKLLQTRLMLALARMTYDICQAWNGLQKQQQLYSVLLVGSLPQNGSHENHCHGMIALMVC